MMIKKERKGGFQEESQKGKRISGKSGAVLTMARIMMVALSQSTLKLTWQLAHTRKAFD